MKNKRWCVAPLIIFFLGLFVSALYAYDDHEENRATLKGLSGFFVFVDVGTNPEPALLSLKNQLQTDAELKLRLAGIKVFNEKEYSETKRGACLYIRVQQNKETTRIVDRNSNKEAVPERYNFYVSLKLLQYVFIGWNPSISTRASTWEITSFGYLKGKELKLIRDCVKDGMDRFINAYLSVNPKK